MSYLSLRTFESDDWRQALASAASITRLLTGMNDCTGTHLIQSVALSLTGTGSDSDSECWPEDLRSQTP